MMTTKTKAALAGALLLAGTVSSSAVNAASVSYYINQSNVSGLADGTNYLLVTMDDNTASPTPAFDNLITFTVEVLTTSNGGVLVPTNNFGIQSFAFNLFGTPTPSPGDIISLPSGWSVDIQAGGFKRVSADGFGKHDVFIGGGGSDRFDPLSFAIDVDGDSFMNYFAPSDGGGQGLSWFSAHVAGIETNTFTVDGDSAGTSCNPSVDDPCIELPSAWFGSIDEGGGGPPQSVVPVPAAVWLFGSGLLGLVGIARPRKV